MTKEKLKKPCRICLQVKTLSMFYKHPKNKDGRDGRCIVCNLEYSRQHGRANYNPERERLNYLKKKKLGKVNAMAKKMLSKYPEKHKARSAVRSAILSGKLIRLPCEVCGETKSEAHHEDYSKPLEVKWLCNKHHCLIHRKPSIKLLDLIKQETPHEHVSDGLSYTSNPPKSRCIECGSFYR